MKLEKIILVLDPDDFRDILAEFELRKDQPLPEGESNDEGAMIGEIIRDLNEYRAISDARNLKKPVKKIGVFNPSA